MLVSNADFACWLVDSLSCGLLAIDALGSVRALNADAQRLLGCPAGPPEQALGLDFRDVLAGQPLVVRLLCEALDGGVTHPRAELLLASRGGGPPATVGFSLTPVRDPQGTLCGAALYFRDISGFERMDEQLRLHDRLAALGEMAAGMAHEIRNPVAAMQVLADLIGRRLEGQGEARSLLAELARELRSVERVLGQGLDFVRPTPLLCKSVHAVQIVERALERARARTDFPGAVERDFEPGLPLLCADPEQLQTVVTDLLVNAMQALAAGPVNGSPRIGIRLHSRSAEPARRAYRVPEPADASPGPAAAGGDADLRELVLSVADNGPGVPASLRERIFYPFFTTREKGSGLGLATAQKIAAGHGGRIEVEAATDGGAIFHLCLPLGGGPLPGFGGCDDD